MPRQAKPFFWESEGVWALNVTEGGRRRRIILAEGRKNFKAAIKRFHEYKASQKPATEFNRRQPQQGAAWVVVERFLEHAKANNAPKTYEWYSHYQNDFLAHLPDGILISELKAHHVTDWLNKHPDWKSSRACATNAVCRAFRWAYEEGRIDKYPFRGLKNFVPPPRETIIDADLFAEILKYARPDFAAILKFMRYTGARPQEARNVLISQVDWPNNRIVMPPDAVGVKGRKGKKRTRIIYLSADAIEVVKASIGRRISGHIFCGRGGKPFSAASLSQRFVNMKEKLGKRYCATNLRHSFATHALTAGVDSVAVGVLMGHANPGMVAKVYQHIAKLPAVMQSFANRASPKTTPPAESQTQK